MCCITNFPYLRKVWKKNTEEERLLGVSLTGIMDNLVTNSHHDALGDVLSSLRATAVDTNEEYARMLGIPQSAAITCVKPSGTVSQLVNSAGGIHTRHSEYYIRTVRGDRKDPLTQFMIDAGIPAEPDFYNPENNMLFSFPSPHLTQPLPQYKYNHTLYLNECYIFNNLSFYICIVLKLVI